MQVLYATKFGEISIETAQLGHGVFSYFLVQGLRGKAQGNDGLITFDTLKSYVQDEVAKWTFRRDGRTQRPFSTDENYGVFVLGGKGDGVAMPQQPIAPTPRPTPVPVVRPTPQPTPTPYVPAVTAPPRIASTNTNLISGRYINHGNGTVTDTKTKLMWKRCSEGQSGDNCSGTAGRYKWDEAMSKFGSGVSFAGYSDWRMPTHEELRTLVYCSNGTPQETAWHSECGKNGEYQRPTINQTAFPNTGYRYWSSTEKDASFKDADSAWFVDFYYGADYWASRDYDRQMRLVRSGQ